MGALHELNPSYYGSTNAVPAWYSALGFGHPSDQWGYALGVGLKVTSR